MGQADAILCSPPYADSVNDGRHGIDPAKGKQAADRPRSVGRQRVRLADYTAYGTTPGQVGALKAGPCPGGEGAAVGQAEAILCSPPYAESLDRRNRPLPGIDWAKAKEGGRRSTRARERTGQGYGAALGQLGALKAGPCPGGEAEVGDDVETLTWGGCYSQGWGRGLLSPGAFAHPAKFAYGLLTRLYDHGFERGWWQKHSLICDPFGGVGCGGVVAAYRGLRWVGCELEPRFISLAEETFALHRGKWAAAGDIPPVIVQGDSRRFAALVAGAAACVTSPPYADSNQDYESGYGYIDLTKRKDGPRQSQKQTSYGATPGQIGALKAGDADAVLTSPPYAGQGENAIASGNLSPAWREEMRRRGHAPGPAGASATYGVSAGQVASLPQGDADGVITSPPYADVQETRGAAAAEARRERDRQHCLSRGSRGGDPDGPGNLPQGTYGTTPGQLGALKAGDADGVLASPPYADTATIASGVQHNPGNVGGLAAGDADGVVTSPPWEDSLDRGTVAKSERIRYARDHGIANAEHVTPVDVEHARQGDYGTAPGQVGALRQETYWDAVRCIYGQAYLALKPGGVACVVVKDFVRARRRVPLCDQTWRLLLSLGFQPVERIRCLLSEETREPSLFGGVEVKKRSRQSFFRRLATKKGAPDIPYEEILVVRRPPGAGEGPADG